jgi:hypothetical protein
MGSLHLVLEWSGEDCRSRSPLPKPQKYVKKNHRRIERNQSLNDRNGSIFSCSNALRTLGKKALFTP